MQSKSIAEIGLVIVQELEELSRFFLIAAGLFGFVFVGVVLPSHLHVSAAGLHFRHIIPHKEKPRIASESRRFLTMPSGSYDLLLVDGGVDGCSRGGGVR